MLRIQRLITILLGGNNTRKSRLTEMKEYAKEASKYLHDGCCVLAVAAGPCYLAIAFLHSEFISKHKGTRKNE